jgi:hypothetical protein
MQGIEKKEIQDLTKKLLKEKILMKTKQMVKIHPDWGKEDFQSDIIFRV